jgi:hypothetical protein
MMPDPTHTMSARKYVDQAFNFLLAHAGDTLIYNDIFVTKLGPGCYIVLDTGEVKHNAF